MGRERNRGEGAAPCALEIGELWEAHVLLHQNCMARYLASDDSRHRLFITSSLEPPA